MDPRSRPSELDDAVWLRARYERDGDMAIALDLHVSRGAVRNARERLGIPSQPVGPRRGVSCTLPGMIATARVSALDRVAARVKADSLAGVPPTERMCAARTLAYNRARVAGDRLAMRDTAISAAAAWARLFDHLQSSAAA